MCSPGRSVQSNAQLMAMEGPVFCRPAMQAKLPAAALINNSLTKSGQLGTALFGAISKYRNISRFISPISQTSTKNIGPCCSFSSSSDGNGYMAGNSSESDEDYVNSTVLEAVEVRSGSEGYVIKMRDGKNLRCVHSNFQGRNIPENTPQPAIVLRIEDGSGTLLPIIVLEMPSVLLMAAIRNVHIARPTIYQVVKEMIDKMGYEVKLVRVNKRIQEAYCAELYLTKVNDPTDNITFDLRPSDAINIAVRCKVPVQVHRSLAYSDGIRPVEPARMAVTAGLSDGLLFTELDRPDGQPCVEAQEFGLVRNMLIAAIEERYKDAASWKDKLIRLRSKRENWA
ncbi:wound responsive protein isoform X1 [Zea mays]|nr:wound responsive protein isoform X1 [Zea mays]|eukprot:XP_008681158.1 wound responsive protein isoform X1 [Zea mays]